jgi:HK97 family phage major capsid protein/HK97 family phage prohead protease
MRYQQRAAPADGAADEFVLSDGSIDRMGDAIDPAGWDLTNFKRHPVALFNHDRDQVIGKWADVSVRGDRLVGRLVLAEPGTSPLVDSIRSLVKQNILRAVSVGFRALKSEPLNDKADKTFGPFKFTKSELLEASLVSVPANPNALAVAKDLPRDLLAEIFAKPGTEYSASIGARHGKPAEPKPRSMGTPMNTIAQRIQHAQTSYNALRESLKALSDKEDLTGDDAKEYDELPGRIDAAKKELEKHQRAERALVDGGDGNGRAHDGDDPIIMPKPDKPAPQLPAKQDPPRFYAQPKKQLVTGDLMLRALSVMAKSQAVHEHDMGKTLRDLYGGDEMVGVVLRAAVNPAQTTVATWAAELVTTENVGFLDRLIPASIYQQLAAMGARYTFGNAGVLKIPVRAASPTLAGNWVGEGAAKPVRRASFSTVSLTPTKLSVISTFTEEMATYGSPAIEGIIRQAMADDTSIALDTFLIDAVASSATRPAGLLNGVTPITASAATPATAAMVADLKALVAAITAANGGRKVAIIMNPAQALALGFAQTTTGDFLFTDRAEAGGKFGVSFIVSNTCPAARVIAVDAEDFASATGDTPRFAVSTDATLHEEDTTPLAIGTPGAPATIAAPARSLFQTDAVAIRMSLYVSWAMRRTLMVQTISPVIW